MWAGWITIGTRNDTSKFDKQMAQVEKRIQRAENRKVEIEVKLDGVEEQIQEAYKLDEKLQSLKSEYRELETQAITNIQNNKVSDPNLMIKMQEQNELIKETQGEYDKVIASLKKIYPNVVQWENKQQELTNEIAQSKAQIESINLQKQQAQVQSLKGNFDNVGKSIQGSIKNVGRLVIGIFGLRGAYMAVRQASSTLAQYDTTYAANLEYIRWALAQAIAPVLRQIVSLAATLLNYVYAILNAWFGLFGNLDLSAKAFNKMKVGASGAAKAAKEIKKQLAGFDEMNILQDQSSAGGGGGAGGGTPNFDLGAMKGKQPEWLDWIIKNKDQILSIIAGIIGAIAAFKLGLGGIQSLGIGIAIAGIVETIQAVIEYLKDPSWENFGKVISGIGITIAGIATAFGAWPVALAGIAVALYGLFVSNWGKISSFIEEKIAWLDDIMGQAKSYLMEAFGPDIGGAIYDIANSGYNLIKNVYNYLKSQVENSRKLFDGIITFFKGAFTGNWQQAWEGLKQIGIAIFNQIVETIKFYLNMLKDFVIGIVNVFLLQALIIKQQILDGLKFIWEAFKEQLIDPVVAIVKGLIDFIKEFFGLMKAFATDAISLIKTAFTNLWDSFKNKASEAWNSVKSVFSNIGNFFGGIWDTIKSRFTDIGQRVGNAVGGAFKTAVNAVLSAAQRVINGPINAINRLISVINAVPGISLGRLSTITLPRLASGAIINMPNRGVNIGGAIAGESGREGILPLTDTRAMQMLGEEIGKWITINAHITNTMNGRVISRELQKVQNDENFAYNS